MSNVKGKPIGQAHGITVTANYHEPKTAKGKKRMWISIRQTDGKKWKVTETLAYVRGVDILFVADTE